MKLYGEKEERIIYFENPVGTYQLVHCIQNCGDEMYVVRGKDDETLLASVDKEPAMVFFFEKCKKAEEEQ